MDTVHFPPLTSAVFHILLALATGEKHGYEIMKSVQRDSNGKVKMGNGTLYGSLQRMLADKFIEEAKSRETSEDTRRKYYKVTHLGRDVMNAEIQRYQDTLDAINKYKLVPNLLPNN